MLEYLTKRLADLNAKKANLLKRAEESEDVNEVKNIATELDEVNEEIKEAEATKAKVESKENDKAENETEEARSAFNPAQAMNVVSTAKMNVEEERGIDMEDSRSTMEYRTAFMNYVQKGERSEVLQYEKRGTDASGTASNLGVLIPSTVIQKIMEGVEKVYGQLYSRVRKTNVPGGVKYPIGSFSATFNRIAENGKSDRQNAGGVTGSVNFSYKIGEIRIARSLLQTVLSVPAFEEKYAEVIVKAYVKAMDTEIMTGVDGDNECEGILTEAAKVSSRIPSTNIITFTATEMADWKSWQTKLFAKIPLSMRGLSPEFVMTANTYEANIKTLKDNNNRPVYNETYNPVDGAEIARFKGRNVVFVENDTLKDFDDASNNEYFGMLWVPEEAYAVNTNMEFMVKKYWDEELNQEIQKALVINDGKVLDPKYIYLLKKSVVG